MPLYVRVKDKETKHEFDALETDWRIKAGLYEVIKSKRYPAVAAPRQPKHYRPTSTLAADSTKNEEATNG